MRTMLEHSLSAIAGADELPGAPADSIDTVELAATGTG
jgi:hypothetical protein